MPGPAGKRGGNRNGVNAYVNHLLPAGGRKGKAPAWPFPGRAPAGWAELWRRPQAVMWEQNQSELAVARYLKLRHLIDEAIEDGSAKPAHFSELRNTEDSLGLSPKGMQNLKWEIDGQAEVDTSVVVESDDGNAHVINLRERASGNG